MKNYKFYILRDKQNPNDIFYLGLTTQTLTRRLGQHIYKAKWASQPEIKKFKGEKAQYIKMQAMGFDNVEIVQFHEEKFNTKKKAMAHETERIMEALDRGYDLVNVVQRKKAEPTKATKTRTSRYNKNSKFRQPPATEGYFPKKSLSKMKSKKKTNIEREAKLKESRDEIIKKFKELWQT